MKNSPEGQTTPTPRWNFSTRAIHAGYDGQTEQGALNPPIYYSSTFGFESVEQGAARFRGDEPGMIYSRLSNPTVQVLESRLANLESGEAALAFASGMGAISTLMWTILRPGDEVVADLTLYGSTHALLHHSLPQFGIKTRSIDFSHPEKVAEGLTPQTKMVYFESPANPNMRLADIAAVSRAVKSHSNALVVVDNTYCTPYIQRPLELGADVVLHSLTKYLNGHGDVIAGAVISTQDIIDQLRTVGIKDLTGACLSPMDAYLILRGIKTLPVRMERHCASALAIARFLESHAQVASVAYPGLASHPQQALAKSQMALPGAMIAFELKGGVEAGRKFMNNLQLWTRAVSLGDAESLAQHPASMTHSNYTPEERAEHLVSDGLVRLSVGLEDESDLIADLDQALDRA